MKKTIINLSLIFLSNLLIGQNPAEKVKFHPVEDLSFSAFKDSKNKNKSYYNVTYNPDDFIDSFYLPWNYIKETDSLEISKIWDICFANEEGIAASSVGCFTGNYLQYTEQFLKDLDRNLPKNKDDFLDVIGFGITVKTTDVRKLPTEEFCLKRIRNAGEGYPFDYLQSTSIWIGTPIVILEKSTDNMWYFVKSTYSYGWVKSEDIAFVNEQQRKFIISSPKKVVTNDNVVVTTNSVPIKLNLGTLLPSLPNSENLLIPAKSYYGSNMFFDTIAFNSNDIKKFPIEFNKDNVESVLSALNGNKYSWGGIDGGRDCSATLKDYFTTFGIWLPRNSSDQRISGDTINLESLKNDSLKLDKIIKSGLPFLSTIYMKGHIVLYLGNSKNSEPLIFHQAWGVKAFYSDKHLLEVSDYRNEFSVFGIHKRDFFEDEVQTRFILGRAGITSIDPTDVFDKIEKIRVKKFMKNYLTLTNQAKK